MAYIDSVEEFHYMFNHPIRRDSGLGIEEGTAKLRVALLLEELEELSVALNVNNYFKELCQKKIETVHEQKGVDPIETADALADIQYVLSGAILALGYTHNFDRIFDEVHDSNMSKLCTSMEQVNDTIEWYVNEKGLERSDISFAEKNGFYIVYRVSDNKILKNKYYNAANIKQYL